MNKALLVLKILMTLAFGATALAKLTQQAPILESFTRLGYPHYLTYILGTAYILGLVAIWLVGFDAVKKWAYAGFFFAISGALLSHILINDPLPAIAVAGLFWALVVGTYNLETKRIS